ncbi:ribosome biogenesis GTPase [Virgibacillus halotolerans]|uniref:ribosome small subunit-dependent GTPase A n=1 Tax=Virgibacillus halotolerans TaxID=1071053 RepID=UPI001EF8E808|nr:ribosome small subunit-dependent GTPase A [Virgibacillus halotolerans]MBM7599771.1 ribosome biogenesis GTPase [Virgibacillus halotolerans]
MHSLEKIGWDNVVQNKDIDSLARVMTVQKNSYRITDGDKAFHAQVSGRFINEAQSSLDFPAVGDWVEVQKLMDEGKAVIKRVLPRKSQFVRKVAGLKTEAQIVAANMDTVFIVNSLNHDVNVRRIERYVLSAYESGATPVVVLTKKDTCSADMVAAVMAQVEAVAVGVPILAVSNVTLDGMDELMHALPPKRTGALIGSSGVGKSTLINTLLERDVQDTKAIREDDSKGRHTTTHREMFMLPNGALLIDTPGMRELQLWDGESSLDTTFQDIDALGSGCRFHDCQHDTEPGCMIKEALESGELSEDRFQSYVKLQREIAYEKRKQDQKARLEEKNKWKQVTKQQRAKYKQRKMK